MTDVGFTDQARELETLVSQATEAMTAELRAVDMALSTARAKRKEEFRVLLDQKIAAIDPRLMLTARGNRLWEQLLSYRFQEWNSPAHLSHAVDVAIAGALQEAQLDTVGFIAPGATSAHTEEGDPKAGAAPMSDASGTASGGRTPSASAAP